MSLVGGAALFMEYISFLKYFFPLSYLCFDSLLHASATLTAYNNVITNFAGGAGGVNGTGLQNKFNAAEYGIFFSYQGIDQMYYISSFFLFVLLLFSFLSLSISLFSCFLFFCNLSHLLSFQLAPCGTTLSRPARLAR